MIPFATGSSKTTTLPSMSTMWWLICSCLRTHRQRKTTCFLSSLLCSTAKKVWFDRSVPSSYRYKSLNSNVGMSVLAYSPSGAMMTCSRMVSRFSPIRCGLRLTALSCSSSYGIRLSMLRTRKSLEKYAVRTWHVRMWVMRFWTPLIRTPICKERRLLKRRV